MPRKSRARSKRAASPSRDSAPAAVAADQSEVQKKKKNHRSEDGAPRASAPAAARAGAQRDTADGGVADVPQAAAAVVQAALKEPCERKRKELDDLLNKCVQPRGWLAWLGGTKILNPFGKDANPTYKHHFFKLVDRRSDRDAVPMHLRDAVRTMPDDDMDRCRACGHTISEHRSDTSATDDARQQRAALPPAAGAPALTTLRDVAWATLTLSAPGDGTKPDAIHIKTKHPQEVVDMQDRHNPAPPQLIRATPPAAAGRLPVVVGSSGSGKTVRMLQFALDGVKARVVYVSSSIGFKFNEKRPPEDAPDDVWKAYYDRRCPVFIEAVDAAVRDVLGFATSNVAFGPCDLRLIVVLDEMGVAADFTRAACRHWRACEGKLCKAYNVKSVRLVVGGTGTAIDTRHLVSVTSEYDVLNMDLVRDRDWEAVYPKAYERVASYKGSMGARARALLTNRRAAGLLLHELSSKTNSTVADATIEAIRQFVKKNGLKDVDQSELLGIAARALYFAMWKPDTDLLSRAINDPDRLLISKYGVLTDAKHTTTPPTRDKQAAAPSRKKDDARRYRTTPATVAMFLLHFGNVEDAPGTGEGFEQTIADYVQCGVLAACGSRSRVSVADLAQWLFPERGSAPMPVSPGDDQFDVRLADRVSVMQLGTPLHPGQSGNLPNVVANAIATNAIAIALNAPRAAFADVLVFFPNGSWWCIQVKRYPSTKLEPYQASNEAHKMGCDHHWARAGAEAAAASVDYVQTKFKKSEWRNFVKVEGKKASVQRGALYSYLVKTHIASSVSGGSEARDYVTALGTAVAAVVNQSRRSSAADEPQMQAFFALGGPKDNFPHVPLHYVRTDLVSARSEDCALYPVLPGLDLEDVEVRTSSLPAQP